MWPRSRCTQRRFRDLTSAPHEAAHWQDPGAAANNRAGLQADGRHPGRTFERETAAENASRFACLHFLDRHFWPAVLARLFHQCSNARGYQERRTIELQERRQILGAPRVVDDNQTAAPLEGFGNGLTDLLEACHGRRVAGCQDMEIAEDPPEVGLLA